VREEFLHRADVGDARQIIQVNGLRSQQARREAGESGILRPGSLDLSL
jgi:hypothetical protein